MNRRDCSFLLLTGKLGDPDRHPLTTAQLRLLTQRAALLPNSSGEEILTKAHLSALGLDEALSERILRLLEDSLQLNAYLEKARKCGCIPITRTNPWYPLILRKRLGNDAPGCLWVKGDSEILRLPAVALVGSRDLHAENRIFAKEVGCQAARQGYALVSGNARGADQTAQSACLEAGGTVISVVADALAEHRPQERVLYVSEEDFDAPFSAPRALHRNRIIHAWGEITFAAQCTYGRGGTWQGSCQNLRRQWSSLFCYQDGSEAFLELERMGAVCIEKSQLADFHALSEFQLRFL